MPSYQLPQLPYAPEALEPVISAEIMSLHHGKHHQTYVTNLNTALEKYAKAEQAGDMETMIELQSAIRFNGGGHINHSIFWTNLAPNGQGGGTPLSGTLGKEIEKKWQSLDKFIDEFSKKAVAIQGSGWCWLG